MKAEDWALLDWQALGAVRLSMAKNVAYNVVNEKTTYGLLKALSNMYEKPSASNKVFLIRQLVNTKMNEGASVADHVNEFNSILSRLTSVDIKFDDEVQALLLLSSLPESWSCTVTTVSGSTGSTKLKFDNIRDLILGEDICRKTSGEYSNYLLSEEDKGRGRKQDITYWNYNQKGHFQNQCSKPVISRDKEVNIAARDYDDALLRSGKVCLADDKTLDIVGVGDVVLKTSFGTNWTLKDVRYIPGLKKRLISVGQLDEERYHVGFGDQQWKVTKGSLVVARGNKRESLYMVEVPSDGINAAFDGRGNATLWHQRLGHMSGKGMKILALKGRIPDLQKDFVGFCEPCVLGKQKKADPATMLPLSMTAAGRMQKTVPETPQQNGVAERMNRTLNERAKSEINVARDKLDAKSVKCTFIGYGSDEMGYRFWDSKSHKVVRSRDVTFNKDSLYGAKAATYSSNLTKPNQKDQMVLEDSPDNLANKSIVTENGLSSEITQSPSESLDASEGSENNGSFEDSRRSDEEDSEDRASSEEGGSKTPRLRRSTKVQAPLRYAPSAT
ncbi:retrovirus-related pol polyprotein from transposon TNT 1-94 [Tanacetum coccineum]